MGGREGSVGSGSNQGGAQVPSPTAQLSEFCRVLVEMQPELGVDQVRSMALAQSVVVGVPPAESEDAVSAVIEQLFPSELGGAGTDEGVAGTVDLD